MQLNKTKGVAMIAALSLMVIAAGVIAYLFANSMNEIRSSGNNVAVVQSLALARGGATISNVILKNQVKDMLITIVENESNYTAYYPFGQGVAGEGPSPQSVISELKTKVISELQTDVDALICNQNLDYKNTTGTVAVRIYFTDTACGTPLPSKTKLGAGRFVEGKKYAIPFVLVSEAMVGQYKRNIVIQGEYQFNTGGEKFSKYALFTNKHEAPDGSDVWFTGETLFGGPVHTNEYFRFYNEPWFGGTVTSAGCSNPDAAIASASDPENISCGDSQGAKFYSTNPQFISADDLALGVPTGTDSPVFASGAVEYKSNVIALPDNAFEQKTAAQDSGLYFPSDLYSLKLFAADATGNLLTKTTSGWTPTATYQYIESCTTATSCTTYRFNANGDLYEQNTDGSWPTIAIETDFNGVIYAEGDIDRLSGPDRTVATSTDPDLAPPALAAFSQITVVSENDTRITGDLKYEDEPCTGTPVRETDGSVTAATCDNVAARNVLGVYTSDGDILIGNQNTTDVTLNAPDNITIHASLMSAKGVVTVENYNIGLSRGSVNLLGGIIENNYGAFGTFDAATGNFKSGFSRSFTYDERLADNVAPPFFPTTGKNGVTNAFAVSFAQREQVY